MEVDGLRGDGENGMTRNFLKLMREKWECVGWLGKLVNYVSWYVDEIGWINADKLIK